MEMDESTSAGIDVSELHDYTMNVVKFILNNSIDKHPIKRTDISKHALRENNKLAARVIQLAQKNLQESYGLELIEVPQSGVKQYICVSIHTAESLLEYTKQQKSQNTLLFLILTVLFMKGPMNEESLYNYLKLYNIDVKEPHDYFGSNLQKLITETFVKQLYLKKIKEPTDNPSEPIFVYSWGFRSEVEFPKSKVLDSVSGLLEKQPSTFVEQYREVCNDVQSGDEDIQ